MRERESFLSLDKVSAREATKYTQKYPAAAAASVS
jgi:hypothetical protein